MTRVVILMQENKTPDFYFPTLSLWGANIHNGGQLLSAPPTQDPQHDRDAWVHYQIGDYAPPAEQIDNDAVLPYYSWLAKLFTYCDYHFGLGTNSTPGNMLAVGGQTPTLRNPPSGTSPTWDLPSIFKHVEAAGISWGAFTGTDLYPVKFYQELGDAASLARIHTSTQPSDDAFTYMAAAGTLPQFCFVWSPSGYDEHAPDTSPPNPQFVTVGQDLTWQRVDAVVKAGGWQDTVFILTWDDWDDWGGYADHVKTPMDWSRSGQVEFGVEARRCPGWCPRRQAKVHQDLHDGRSIENRRKRNTRLGVRLCVSPAARRFPLRQR